MLRLLVVEDEPKLRKALAAGLAEQGYAVLSAETAPQAAEQLATAEFSAVVLDLGLPGGDGLEVLRAARAKGKATPVLILTARDTVSDRVAGLDAGADDYLVKPFAWAELLARLRALVRRGAERTILRVSDLEMDLVHRRVARSGQPIVLTNREWEVLEYLMRNVGNVVSREALSRDVWAEPEILTNVIEVCIRGLRQKVDAPFVLPLIHTVRGVGYMIRENV